MLADAPAPRDVPLPPTLADPPPFTREEKLALMLARTPDRVDAELLTVGEAV